MPESILAVCSLCCRVLLYHPNLPARWLNQTLAATPLPPQEVAQQGDSGGYESPFEPEELPTGPARRQQQQQASPPAQQQQLDGDGWDVEEAPYGEMQQQVCGRGPLRVSHCLLPGSAIARHLALPSCYLKGQMLGCHAGSAATCAHHEKS